MGRKIIEFFFSKNGVFTGVWLTTVVLFTAFIYFQKMLNKASFQRLIEYVSIFNLFIFLILFTTFV
jgi:hypothetical protein